MSTISAFTLTIKLQSGMFFHLYSAYSLSVSTEGNPEESKICLFILFYVFIFFFFG